MSQQIADDLDAFGGRTVVITGGGSGMGLSTPAWLSIVPAASYLWAVPWAG